MNTHVMAIVSALLSGLIAIVAGIDAAPVIGENIVEVMQGLKEVAK
jgi:ABC-type phosphate/phosphonate transport system permease subunit